MMSPGDASAREPTRLKVSVATVYTNIARKDSLVVLLPLGSAASDSKAMNAPLRLSRRPGLNTLTAAACVESARLAQNHSSPFGTFLSCRCMPYLPMSAARLRFLSST